MDRCDLVYAYSTGNPFVAKSLRLIEECLDQLGNDISKVCLGFNGGKDCTVLLVLVRAVLIEKGMASVPLKGLNISSNSREDSFPEMEEFVHQCTLDYNLKMTRLTGTYKAALLDLKNKDPVIEAIFMGTRSTDVNADESKKPKHFEVTDEGWPEFLRVCPILDWDYHEVWKFIMDLTIPYCSLYDQGYTSIGSVKDTKPNPRLITPSMTYLPAHQLEDPEDERRGRSESNCL
jgi:FAD synthetase